ncbi:MAG: type IV-A pilus assembly ATPase PilB [Chromatiales bacterium]|nr:type IV-A pilus assembly ATPase PilB [Chromatiales bacterium]
MATINPQLPLSGLARRLVLDRLLTEQDAVSAYEQALKTKVPFVSYLVQNNLADPRQIAWSASQEFGVPLFDIKVMEMDMAPLKLVKEKLIRQHHALPLFKRGARLYVAVSDPTNLLGLDEIKFQTGLTTSAVLVEEDRLSAAIEKALDAQTDTMGDLADTDLDNLEISGGDEDLVGDDDAISSAVDDTPVVRYVNKVLLDAINKGASDIHFEPYEKTFRIRFRQDGMLTEVAAPPVALSNRLISRIKVMSRMDIAERRVPQDGRIKMKLSRNRAIDFRVNTCPTLFGEKVVLRILDPSSAQVGIEKLGFEEEQRKHFEEALEKPYGMILVTGPTGSGKTVSLYTGLNMLNKPHRNISTAEDPVEINVAGINQVNVNPKTGLTFAEALRAFLRQDPDIIMVGEIRDLETAEIAVKAAQTGHLVLSTLHTNDAPQTLVRLAQMGIPPYNIASAVVLIMAQRLARRLCDQCKKPVNLPKEVLLEEGFKEAEIPSLTVFGPVGCPTCDNKGYKGRVGIFQVMPVGDEIEQIILDGGNAMQIAAIGKKLGYSDLRNSGLKKVRDGLIGLDELNRVTKD